MAGDQQLEQSLFLRSSVFLITMQVVAVLPMIKEECIEITLTKEGQSSKAGSILRDSFS